MKTKTKNKPKSKKHFDGIKSDLKMVLFTAMEELDELEQKTVKIFTKGQKKLKMGHVPPIEECAEYHSTLKLIATANRVIGSMFDLVE